MFAVAVVVLKAVITAPAVVIIIIIVTISITIINNDYISRNIKSNTTIRMTIATIITVTIASAPSSWSSMRNPEF